MNLKDVLIGIAGIGLGIGWGIIDEKWEKSYKEEYNKYSDDELVDRYYKLQKLYNDDFYANDRNLKMKFDIVEKIMKERNLL